MTTSKFQYIDNQALLEQLVELADPVPTIAIDTEANSLHNYFEKVCLIQISFRGGHFIVDPLADINLSPLLEAFHGKTLILHGADFDLRMLRSSFGFVPGKPVYDTMLAAQLLGYEHVGLAALVERFFDVSLPKKGQKSNWARRPLSLEQLDYASDDTRYLEDLSALLHEELALLARDAWHLEWCQKVMDAVQQDPGRDEENAWRIKGLSKLDRRQLAFARSVWHWRDLEARKMDRPPFMVMRNQDIIDIALACEKKGIDSLANNGIRLPRNCTGSRLAALQGAVKEAARLKRDEWPEKRRSRDTRMPGPEIKTQVEALRKACADIAHELNLPPSVVAPRAALEAIARTDSRTFEAIRSNTGLMTWQAELMQPAALDVLSRLTS